MESADTIDGKSPAYGDNVLERNAPPNAPIASMPTYGLDAQYDWQSQNNSSTQDAHANHHIMQPAMPHGNAYFFDDSKYSQPQQSLVQPDLLQPAHCTSLRSNMVQCSQNAQSRQQPEYLNPLPLSAGNISQEHPAMEQQPQHPSIRQPRFLNVVEAWSRHLITPGWRPSVGTYGMPLSDNGKINDVGMLTYVAQLYNAFIDLNEVYDEGACTATVERFQANGAYGENPSDIEAVCHVIVGTATYLHTHGATSLAYKRIAGRIPQVDSPNHNLTFAQRIWLLACLVKHYKIHADALMRMCLVEDYLVGIWGLLASAGFFRVYASRSVQERCAWDAEFRSLGVPQTLPVVDAVTGLNGTYAEHGIEQSHKEANVEDGLRRGATEAGMSEVPGRRRAAERTGNIPAALSAQLGPVVSPQSAGRPVDPLKSLEDIIKQRSEGVRNSLHMPSRFASTQELSGTTRSFSGLATFSHSHWGDPSRLLDPPMLTHSPSLATNENERAMRHNSSRPNTRGFDDVTGSHDLYAEGSGQR